MADRRYRTILSESVTHADVAAFLEESLGFPVVAVDEEQTDQGLAVTWAAA